MKPTLNDIIFISAQPHDFYFVWQIEIQIVNFRKFGISDKMQVLIWFPDSKTIKDKVDFQPWLNLSKKYPEVKFFFYKDKGLTPQEFTLYISQLRPQILAKHFDTYPELKDKIFFYHDSDIIFNYLPDFQSLIEDDVNWQSDTSSYLDYNYLRSKEIQGGIPKNLSVLKLAEIGGVTINTFKEYKGKTGGAQYILKGIDGDFWRDVEKQCIQIIKAFNFNQPGSVNSIYFKSENEGFQSWCADMWAVNMALWKRGKITDITDELDFSWATDLVTTYAKKPIYHNAGAGPSHKGIFYKGNWRFKSPLKVEHDVNDIYASWYYVQAMKEIT